MVGVCGDEPPGGWKHDRRDLRALDDGAADVVLPAWFETVNTGIRYQLTAIGRAAPDLHVERELKGSRFRIAGGHKAQRICWQLTGRRADAWAAANPQVVEIDKSGEDQGFYRHPELLGLEREKRIDRQQRDLEPLGGILGPDPVLTHDQNPFSVSGWHSSHCLRKFSGCTSRAQPNTSIET